MLAADWLGSSFPQNAAAACAGRCYSHRNVLASSDLLCLLPVGCEADASVSCPLNSDVALCRMRTTSVSCCC